MSKSTKPARVLVPEFTPAEVDAHVAAVALPAALQGVDEWNGSRDVGGNPAAHLAALNGKGQTVALCQVFADLHFGAESRANLLQGIVNSRIRRAFDVATADHDRRQPLTAGLMLAFLRDYVRAALESSRLTPEALAAKLAKADAKAIAAPAKADAKVEAKDEAETTSTPTATTKDDDARAAQAAIIAAQNIRIAELEAALAKAQEQISAARAARTVKAVREALAA